MRTLLIITECLPLASLTSCAQVTTNSDAVWITHIICATILLLSIVLSILMCVLRWKQNRSRKKEKDAERQHEIDMMNKQLETKKEEEKKLYRSQLANFMEKHSIKVETISENGKQKKCIIRAMNPTEAQNYINELKSIIKDLNTTS